MGSSRLEEYITDALKLNEESSARACYSFALGISLVFLLVFISATIFFHYFYFSSPPTPESMVGLWQAILVYSFIISGGVLVSGIIKVSDKFLTKMATIYAIVCGVIGFSAVVYSNTVIDTGMF